MRNPLLTAVLPRLVLIAAILLVAGGGGYYLLGLVLIPVLAWDMFKAARPSAGRVAPRFAELGRYRVVLQVAGSSPIPVIREVRRTTGRSLQEAVALINEAPVVVAEGLSETSANLVADRLREAGARALAAPIGDL
jgi:ribosomal protein L7/L12